MQTSISNTMAVARPGMIAYPMREARVQTYAAQGAVKFGYCVVKGTAATQAKIPTVVGDIFLGIAQMTLAINEQTGTDAQYPDKEAMNVLKFGEIWVPYSGTAPTVGATLYVDVLVVPGKVTAVSTNNMTAPLKCVAVDTSLTLALVQINSQV